MGFLLGIIMILIFVLIFAVCLQYEEIKQLKRIIELDSKYNGQSFGQIYIEIEQLKKKKPKKGAK
jgi:hypothetical protein